MMQRAFCFLAAFVAVTLFSFAADAGEPRLQATFGKWNAYILMEDGHKACYMATQPIKSEGKYDKRGDAYAIITHRPSDGSRNVFSFIAGYTYKPGEEASVEIDGQKFALFTQDDTAWAPDAETDGKIAKAIREGKTMIVRGVSSRGTKTTDDVSLDGSSAAYDKIGDEC